MIDPALKLLRLREIEKHSNSTNFKFIKADIADREFMKELFVSNDLIVSLILLHRRG